MSFRSRVCSTVTVVTIALTGAAAAQVLEPYPSASITEAQWQAYFHSVDSAHRDSRRRVAEQHLVLYGDEASATSWVFTELGHPAHPSWIARRVIDEGGASSIQQVGYYAGRKAPFAAFFQEYLNLNRQIEQSLN